MKKPNLNFKVGDSIIVNEPKENSQVLKIKIINYVDKNYILEEPWINSLSKFKSIDFDKAHQLFKLYQ